MESVAVAHAEATDGITIRRGTAVAGLLTAGPQTGGAPRVTGVLTGDGDTIAADLVVDATGRRSGLPRLLAAIGGGGTLERWSSPPASCTSADTSGRPTGRCPRPSPPLLDHYDSFSILTLPADNGTWGVGIIAPSEDPALRAAQDLDVWERIIRSCPNVAHWIDAEPISDGVAVMAKPEDRLHEFVVDGEPVVTGVLAG